MSTSPHQLFLLADHVKLSLLERQRAVALNLEPTKQDGHITRSLETMRDGIENLNKQIRQLSSTGDDTTDLRDQTARLHKQFTDLTKQFPSSSITIPALFEPNDPSLAPEFSRATQAKPSKSVRFHDDPNSTPFTDDPDGDDENRSALFNNNKPYTDDPSSEDQSGLSNQQIHAYHKQVLSDQDAQLDTLGQSIGRQRTLGLAMGEELDEHNELLTDVESGVDRHQSTLDRAQGRLKNVARKTRENGSWVLIGCLMLILILLIALT